MVGVEWLVDVGGSGGLEDVYGTGFGSHHRYRIYVLAIEMANHS